MNNKQWTEVDTSKVTELQAEVTINDFTEPPRWSGLRVPQAIKWLQQREDGCLIACLAMVTGIPLEVAHSELYNPTDAEAIQWLCREGIVVEATKDYYSWHPRWFEYGVSILTVPSLNKPGLTHAIVALHFGPRTKRTKTLILDPNNGRPGRKVVTAKKIQTGKVNIIEHWGLVDCRIPGVRRLW